VIGQRVIPATALAAVTLAVAGVATAETGVTQTGVTAVAAEPSRARPAESGARDSAATVGPLAIGAVVADRNGEEIGQVTRLTTDAGGRSVVEVRNNEDLYSIPVEQLFAHGGRAFSVMTLERLKHSAAAQ
jgi:hypothetical protein